MSESLDARQYAPATERNRNSILEVLLEVLPPTGTVLEVSSGTGEHAVFFAPQLHPRKWIPSDPNPVARASIAAWREHCPTDNLDALTQAEVESVLHQAVDRAVECDRLSGPSDEVKGVVFSPNGKIIASTSDGKTIARQVKIKW